jgi:hypothetical protein
MSTAAGSLLAGLEQQNRDLSQIEINKVLRFVRHIRAEVSTHYAVPSGVVLLVELLLDISSDILRASNDSRFI